jgi:hypothetical protein
MPNSRSPFLLIIVAALFFSTAIKIPAQETPRERAPEPTTAGTTTAEPVNPLEELPIENGKINVNKLIKTMDMESQKVLQRIQEIDAIVNVAFAEKAVELYGLSTEEYNFLRRQAEAPAKPLSQFFRAERSTGLNPIEEAERYFTNAHKAISSGEYWFGREETLVSKDKALLDVMKQKVAVELAKTEEGMKIIELQEEKSRLLSLLTSQKPLFEYLIERRNWWKYYPEYENLVKQMEQEKALNIMP